MELLLTQIADHCYHLIDDAETEVPMDTKLNCGIFIVLKANLSEDGVDVIFNNLRNNLYDAKSVLNLCLCFGTITVITDLHLEENDGLRVLAAVVAHLICIAAIHSIEQNVLIGVCRALVQLSKNLLLFKLVNVDASLLISICRVSISFVWSHAEHYMDCVRHLSKDLLRNLLKLGAKYESLQFVAAETLNVVLQNDATTTTTATTTDGLKCLALDYLCQVYETEFILRQMPQLNELLRPYLERMDQHWIGCYERLMRSHARQIPLDDWYARWVQPTLYLNGSCGREDQSMQLYENLIGSCIKARPEVTTLIFQEQSQLPIKTYLFVMWTVRKQGLQLSADDDAWKPATDPIITDAMVHVLDDIRIMPLRILIETYRTTEPFTVDDYSAILRFLYYNCNCQCPAMRQQILAYSSKMFQRIEAAAAAPKTSALHRTEAIDFLRKLRDLCLWNLFDTANFSRRAISLSLLVQCIKTASTIQQDDDTIWTDALVRKLYETVRNDSYEGNKALANDALRFSCPRIAGAVHVSDKLSDKIIVSLMNSIRPSDSQASAYVLEFRCIINANFLPAIEWCLCELEKSISVARESLLEAARSGPMYGIVLCIRHLIGTIDLKQCNRLVWRPLVARVLRICKELLQLVAPIVNSSSPEGHFPAAEMGDDEDNIISNAETTPQMVLLCAWRTVKEVSLLLGDLALTAPLLRNSDHDGLISVAELLDVGQLFQDMLAEIKHRGAFEQAYVGFSKLCVRLWRSADEKLHRCPMEWLQRMITMIMTSDGGDDVGNSDQQQRICATRRSAGVPFMIQAIITSELQVCSSVGLQYCMQHLFAVVTTSTTSPERVEARTHALNILRALFRFVVLLKLKSF